LISSQLDVDRLDYLKRDSFFTGVSEGIIAADRIINMFEIHNDHLVVEEKGIYSVENFLLARRMMYWQVYLHKTVIVADFLLLKVLQRAKFLYEQGVEISATPALLFFFKQQCRESDFHQNPESLIRYAELDDYDVFAAIKQWQIHSDSILSYLSYCIVNRQLFAVEMQSEPFSNEHYLKICDKAKKHFNIKDDEISYFVIQDEISNNMYDFSSDNIFILKKNNSTIDIADATDHANFKFAAAPVVKYVLAYPKILR
jgi:HD superfamily phosphohydrolase